MSAYVLLNLLNELEEKIRCEAVPSILSIFSKLNEVNKIHLYKSTNARFYLSYDTKIAFNSRFSHRNLKMSP